MRFLTSLLIVGENDGVPDANAGVFYLKWRGCQVRGWMGVPSDLMWA